MSGDLISRKDLIKVLAEHFDSGRYAVGTILGIVDAIPAVEQGEAIGFIPSSYLESIALNDELVGFVYRDKGVGEVAVYTAPPQSQGVKDALEKAANSVIASLKSYKLTNIVDEYGDGLPLVDAISPPWAKDISLGIDEIERLADFIGGEIIALIEDVK